MLVVLSLLFSLGGCNSDRRESGNAGEQSLFAKGEKAPQDNFTGIVSVNRFVLDSDSLDCLISNVTFEPKARTKWHTHPGGQVLLVTNGSGYYQEKGKLKQLIHKGDVIKCPAGVVHWHGAGPESALTHIAVATNIKKGIVIWMQPVTDEEYGSFN